MSNSVFGANVDFSKLRLHKMTCPTCGAPLQFQDGDSEVVCVCCGNKYIPSFKQSNREQNEAVSSSNVGSSQPQSGGGLNGVVKIDGIKTASSALAYIEQFLDAYDWDMFAYDSDYTIDELFDVVEGIKITSADDYRTWKASILALIIPFSKKIEYRKKVFEEIIDEYKKGNFDAYSMFEQYRQVSLTLLNSFDDVQKEAERYLGYALKYGLPKDEEKVLKDAIKSLDKSGLENDANLKEFDEIPEIAEFDKKKEKEIIKSLKDQGIDPDQSLEQAELLINEQQYVQALELLYKLGTYKHADEKVRFINRYFKINDVFINQGNFYYLNKSGDLASLHQIIDGKIVSTPVAKNVYKGITCFAGNFYYFDGNHQVVCKNLSSGELLFCSTRSYDLNNYRLRLAQMKCYFIANDDDYTKKINVLDLANNKIDKVVSKLSKVLTIFEKHALCYVSRIESNNSKDEMSSPQQFTKKGYYLINLETAEAQFVTKTEPQSFILSNNKLFYSIDLPNKKNKAIICYDLVSKESSEIERNITGSFFISDNHIYYFTKDNTGVTYLISNNIDGTDRRELCGYARSIAFESGEWLYFTKVFRYNSALCKMKYDGSQQQVIAYQISEFIKMDGGYIYYIDYSNNLHKVRNDGSRNTVLAKNVKEVVKVNGEKLVYEAEDGEYNVSLFAIDFNKEGRRKASYGVSSSKLYDDNIVYFIKKTTEIEKDKDGNDVVRVASRQLCSVDLTTYKETVIAKLNVEAEPRKIMKVVSSVFSWIFGAIWVIILFIIAGTGNALPTEYCDPQQSCYYYAYSGYRCTTTYNCYNISSSAGWFLVVFFILVRIGILIFRQIALRNRKLKVVTGILTTIFSSVVGGILTLCIPDSEYEK